jgi:hypothetical protein
MKNSDKNKDIKEGISRRNVLKGLAALPFAGALLGSSFRNRSIKHYSQHENFTELKMGSTVPEALPVGHPINNPMGQPFGIFPGRVVWVWDREATRSECTNTVTDDGPDFWFQDKNTDQELVSRMIDTGIQQLTGKTTNRESWDAIFRFHNERVGKGNKGYARGEKILIKCNFTSAFTMDNETMRRNYNNVWGKASETSPQVALGVLRHLIHDAGVPQNAIYIGDPQRNIYQEVYEKLHAEFPEVNYLGNNIFNANIKIVENGRTPLTISESELIFYSDKGVEMPDVIADKLYGIFEEMEYLLNIPMMKGHNGGGITAFPKNHFGSQARQSSAHLHDGLVFHREGYGKYRVNVDIMGSEYLGKKNLVYILDSLYPGPDWGDEPVKFRMSPFNDHWASSVFFSFDEVAIESVAFDFLRTEFDGNNMYTEKAFPNYHGCDDNLHQAASESNWPHGIIYAPNGDGKKIPSLGVHEHWNNPQDKQYSRNLGTASGIELVPVLVREPLKQFLYDT